MFSAATPRADVEAFGAARRSFIPAVSAMARATAENLRRGLPGITVPTLLIYGDQDERWPAAERDRRPPHVDLRVQLWLLSGAGHVCNIEAADRFNDAVRDFLRSKMRHT